MTSSGLPTDLLEALRALAEQPDPPPEPFERVARWRRACGDADAAATWQTWSLLPPEPDELRQALAGLWRSLGDTAAAASLLNATEGNGDAPGNWQQLALLLDQAELEAAQALQQQLLEAPPPLAMADLLDLVRLWQQQQQPQQALELLQPLLGFMQQRGERPSAPLCNALADLLEQQERFDEAEPWWQRSHAQQPQQAWPLMRLGRQALRRDQPAVAVHYARQVLERDPAHSFAPRLLRKGLEALGAQRSLQLLEGETSPSQATDAETDAAKINNEASAFDEPPGPAFWQGCRSLALIGFGEASILEGWLQQLQAAATPQELTQEPLQLWLIASPDPLWLEQQATTLVAAASAAGEAPLALQLSSWPLWDPQRHGHLHRAIEATPTAPFWREVQP